MIRNKQIGILTFLLAMLGFGVSCAVDEYGAPFADYVIRGKVADAVTREPIKGIEVNANRGNAKVHTEADGTFEMSWDETFGNPEINISFQDVDGELNGLYEEALKSFTGKFEGGKGQWYKGKLELDTDTVLLTPIEPVIE